MTLGLTLRRPRRAEPYVQPPPPRYYATWHRPIAIFLAIRRITGVHAGTPWSTALLRPGGYVTTRTHSGDGGITSRLGAGTQARYPPEPWTHQGPAQPTTMCRRRRVHWSTEPASRRL